MSETESSELSLDVDGDKLGCESVATASESHYVPYSLRKEWEDVVPIEQDDSTTPVASIHYSDECSFVSLFFLDSKMFYPLFSFAFDLFSANNE